jgi:hypothetical protein
MRIFRGRIEHLNLQRNNYERQHPCSSYPCGSIERRTEETRGIDGRALSPYLLALTPEDRKGMLKMGEKTIGFVEKAFDFAKQNPELVPPYLKISEFETDFADAHGLWTLHNMITQLEEGISGTEMAAGSEAYQASLIFYHSVKMAASQNIPGANAVYEELRKRFPSTKRRTTTSAAEATEE